MRDLARRGTSVEALPARPMTSGDHDRLQLLPSPLYALKAGAVRLRSLTWLARKRQRSHPAGLRILFYHRISPDRDILAVTPERFRGQMAYLAEGGFAVLDLLEAAEALSHGALPPRAVALTFDDAYADVAENALPILESHGFAATVFVVPGAVDGKVHFEWYREMPRLLDWTEITDLDGASPLRFGAHTLTHPNLVRLDDATAEREIAGSKSELEAHLGHAVDTFCYPAGLFGERERALVSAAGYRAAVSCEPGMNHPGIDRLALRRVQIDARDSLLDFRSKVGGGHDHPLPLRRIYRRARFGADPSRTRAASSRR